ncbi:Putative cyclase [Penicillium digitatum]|uniref:Cyclase n=1 Tax=Penicillium digitatum TaxID=36651 RepID=A0A7T6XGM3_PENDI|nr:Putative cyclase [Penicillium digitatum]
MKLEDSVSGSHYGFDDELEFNTQASSQWDSLAHFMHLPTGLVYNGVNPTIEAFQTPETVQHLPTLDHWHQRGCVTGRGVLIDFKSYAQNHGISYDQFSGFRIGISELEAVAAWQGLTFLAGDILLIRFGVTETLAQMTGAEQGVAMSSGKMCGLEGSKEMARWLWDRHFAAVASDNTAVEAMPPLIDGVEQSTHELVLHQWCLSLLGIPLGELWDLKVLAHTCRTSSQYSFLLTSSPLNVPGAVASPPNALAIL